jgi:hypothetical protein
MTAAPAPESANIIQSEALTWAPAQGFRRALRSRCSMATPQRMVRLRYV